MWSISLTGCSCWWNFCRSKDDEAIEVYTNLTRMDPDLCESKWKDLVRRKTAELSEICCSFPRDERWDLELKTWQMKCWETYSCWTQISASPWWRRGWSTEWPTPVGPRSLRVHDGGGVHLDVKVEPPENECLSLRGEMSPEDSVTRWMDMVCRLWLYDIFYLYLMFSVNDFLDLTLDLIVIYVIVWIYL